MEPAELNGITPEELNNIIKRSSSGFSVEDGCVQYLGREIQLKEGRTIVSDQNNHQVESKNLFERLLTLQPEIIEELSGDQCDVLGQALFTMGGCLSEGAVPCPSKKLRYTTTLKYIGRNHCRLFKALKRLKYFTQEEKYQLLSDAQYAGLRISEFHCELTALSSIQEFQLIKGYFQTAEDYDGSRINIQSYNYMFRKNSIAGSLLSMQEIISNESVEVATALSPEMRKIIEKFSHIVNPSDDDLKAFKLAANNFLILAAACADVSEQADIGELMSYMTSILESDRDLNRTDHIARQLYFLSKRPGSIDYSRYTSAIAAHITHPEFTVEKHGGLEQLSDIRGFNLLEGCKPLEPYLKALKQLIQTEAPAYSSSFLKEVDIIERRFNDKKLADGTLSPKDTKAARKDTHRLLLLIAACTAPSLDSMPCIDPVGFIRAIMKHSDYRDILYLVTGLSFFVKSPSSVQMYISQSHSKGYMLLAQLGFVRLVYDNVISENEMQQACNNLRTRPQARHKIKDGKIFHQWLSTLDKMQIFSTVEKPYHIGEMLYHLTYNMPTIYEKLGLIETIITNGDCADDAWEILVLGKQPKELENPEESRKNILMLIAEKGLGAFSDKQPRAEWLLKQRYPHLLPIYLMIIKNGSPDIISAEEKSELISLIDQFVEASVKGEFIKARQSPLANPHLKAVYLDFPKFQAGWEANFTGFSEQITKRLDRGRCLELTEDPWDLFISGLEVNSCQSPKSLVDYNCSLMGYVMDGRNAMLVQKNKNGNILSRAVIRVVLNDRDKPSLFMEDIYPSEISVGALFRDAALEIAEQMQLTLYMAATPVDQSVNLTVIEGRAPYDYFDSSLKGIIKRGKYTIEGVLISKHMPPEQAE